MPDLLSIEDGFLCDRRRKTGRSSGRASEEGRPGEAGDDGASGSRLSPRPDREEDGEQKTEEDERKRQEKNCQ
jgi:hypothetical protein